MAISAAGTEGALQGHSRHVHCRYRLDGAGILRRHRYGRVPCRGDEAQRGQVPRVVLQSGGQDPRLFWKPPRKRRTQGAGPCRATFSTRVQRASNP